MTIRSTTDPERFRTTYYGARRYIDPLPGDGIWEPTGPKEKLVNCTKIAKAIDTGEFWKKLNDNAKAPLDAVRVADYVNAELERLVAMPADERRVVMALSAPADLNRAANRGTAVHALIEGLLSGQTPLVLDDDAEQYRAIAENVASEIAELVDVMEAVGFGRRDDLPMSWGGTYDVFHSSGSFAADYKTRGPESQHACYPKEVAQLGLLTLCEYYIATNGAGEAVRVPMPTFDQLALVSIKPDSFEVYPVDVAEARDAALKALEIEATQTEGKRVARSAVGNPKPFSEFAATDHPNTDTPAVGVVEAVETTTTGGPSPDPDRLAWFSARYDEVREAAGPNAIQQAWPESLSTPKHRDEWTADELEQACAVVTKLHNRSGLAFPDTDPQKLKLRRKPRRTSTEATKDEHAATLAAFRALPEERRHRVTAWQAQGNHAGRSWEARPEGSTRWAIVVNTAAIGVARHTDDDDIARAWLSLVIGEDEVQTFPPGALFGSLSGTEATRLAELTELDTFAAAIDVVDAA